MNDVKNSGTNLNTQQQQQSKWQQLLSQDNAIYLYFKNHTAGIAGRRKIS